MKIFGPGDPYKSQRNYKMYRSREELCLRVKLLPPSYLWLPWEGIQRVSPSRGLSLRTFRSVAYMEKLFFSKGETCSHQAVLSMIPSNYMSLFRILVSVSMNLQRVMRNFLSEGSEEGRGSHQVKWEVVVKSDEMGGLGMRSCNYLTWLSWLNDYHDSSWT